MSEANMTKEPEQWDIYDESRQKTGRTMNRGEHIPGVYHLVVHVCLFSAAGKMLIQQRQPFKEGFPNLWDLTVGGSALAGETSRQAAMRETAEEIGYKLDLAGQHPAFTQNFKEGFDDFWIVGGEADPAGLKLQEAEVQRVCWADQNDVLKRIADGSFIPYKPELIGLLWAMRQEPTIWNLPPAEKGRW